MVANNFPQWLEIKKSSHLLNAVVSLVSIVSPSSCHAMAVTPWCWSILYPTALIKKLSPVIFILLEVSALRIKSQMSYAAWTSSWLWLGSLLALALLPPNKTQIFLFIPGGPTTWKASSSTSTTSTSCRPGSTPPSSPPFPSVAASPARLRWRSRSTPSWKLWPAARWETVASGAQVVVAQLVEGLLLTPEIRSSTMICNFSHVCERIK